MCGVWGFGEGGEGRGRDLVCFNSGFHGYWRYYKWIILSFLCSFLSLLLVSQMILVRNKIVDMFSREKGKITFGRIKYKFRISSNNNSCLCAIYWYSGRVQTSRLLLLSLWRCLSRRGIPPIVAKDCDRIAALNLCTHKHPLKLSAYIIRTAVYAWSGMWSWN